MVVIVIVVLRKSSPRKQKNHLDAKASMKLSFLQSEGTPYDSKSKSNLRRDCQYQDSFIKSNSCPQAFTAEVQIITSAFGYEPCRMLSIN
jgi:hypothetical protein